MGLLGKVVNVAVDHGGAARVGSTTCDVSWMAGGERSPSHMLQWTATTPEAPVRAHQPFGCLHACWRCTCWDDAHGPGSLRGGSSCHQRVYGVVRLRTR